MNKFIGFLMVFLITSCAHPHFNRKTASIEDFQNLSQNELDYALSKAFYEQDQLKTTELIKAGAKTNSQLIENQFVSIASSLGISLDENEYNRKIQLVEFMLLNGVDINAVKRGTGWNDESQDSALTALVRSSCSDMLLKATGYLLRKGINPGFKNALYVSCPGNPSNMCFMGERTAFELVRSIPVIDGGGSECNRYLRHTLEDAEIAMRRQK